MCVFCALSGGETGDGEGIETKMRNGDDEIVLGLELGLELELGLIHTGPRAMAAAARPINPPLRAWG